MEGLSEDLLVEILARVPVKPLLRLRAVCKSWKSTIGSPELRSLHLSTNRDSSKILLTTKYPMHVAGPCDPVEWYLLLDNDQHRPADHSWLAPLHFPFAYPHLTSPHIVGSISGLICVSLSLTSVVEVQANIPIILWNPTIRRHVCLPDLTLTKPNYSSIVFGYDPTTDDYKIVVLTLGKAPEFNVYSLNSNTWRRGFHVCLDRQIKLTSTGAFAGGKMHWLVEFKDFQKNTCLYSFDVAEEVFAEVALPPQDPAVTCVLPQMGAGGWKKLYRVEDPMGMLNVFVCVLKNGELVMDKYYYHGNSYGLAAHDPKAGQFKFLEDLSFSRQRDFGGVASLSDHQESLVLIDCTPIGDPQASCTWSCQVQIKRKTPSVPDKLLASAD
ncbi:F-box and associated interaction domains-containing protein [Striga asiatica]|uniref:F-box and associated interaction domains-containing protein n=1 Tax=Striga asiatica TaxID=4170 RepID=A0A5A7QTK4_STRAF|nr:F-box and associated interaction domains-containing protein [Striga asiatica]